MTLTPAPIAIISSSDRVAPIDACIRQPSTTVRASFEVELAPGTEIISEHLKQILANYLSIKYPPCAEFRRLVVTEGLHSTGDLQQDGGAIRLGEITIEPTDEGCAAKSTLASSCRVINAGIEVFGGDGAAIESSINTSLQSMTLHNEAIVIQLMNVGIVDLRVVDSATAGSDKEKSEANSFTASANENGDAGRETMAIVLSVAGVSLVLVAMLAWGSGWRRRRSHLAYSPTLDEQGYGSHRDGNAAFGTYSDGPQYGFADSTPINSSNVASC
jgi:hypothetical protein